MYGCESWAIKKAESRIDAVELWCWRRLLRVPWTTRRFNQSILKEISPGISLEGMMLKLKLQYFGHLMQRVDSLDKLWCWEGLGAGGEGDDRGWDGWMASPINGREFEWTPRVGDGQGGLACCDSWGHKESDTTEQLIWSDGVCVFNTAKSLSKVVEQIYCAVSSIWELLFLHILSQNSVKTQHFNLAALFNYCSFTVSIDV